MQNDTNIHLCKIGLSNLYELLLYVIRTMKGFLNKVRRASSDEGSGGAIEQAPKADVSIPAKRERRLTYQYIVNNSF